jgi:hypothetical protein
MRDEPLNTLSLICSFANRALSKRFAGPDVNDGTKIEILKLQLTLIRKLARNALPPEYIIDQTDLSPGQAAQRDRRKDN